MKNKLTYFPEPKMQFGFGQQTDDSRDGLTLFGPYEASAGTMRIGVIGQRSSIPLYSQSVHRMNRPFPSSSIVRPFFPGFQAVFGITWPEVPIAQCSINDSEISQLVAVNNLKERTYKLVTLYLDRIKSFMDSEETPIDLWYVIVPRDVWLNCRPKSKSGKMTYSKNQVMTYRSGQTSLFPEFEEIGQYADMYESDSDFHDQLKARALQEKIRVPIQIILENTLQFKSKQDDSEYADDMKAHLAWTHSSSIYYKLGRLPWKLAYVRPGVCYIGLVFKKLEDGISSKKGYACCAAQMFLDSGDGQVFRGNNGPWMSRDERSYHLSENAAYDLIDQALSAYFNRHNEYPAELFIHGRTKFTDDEWCGFQRAVKDPNVTKLVGVTINEGDGFRVFRKAYDRQGEYGVLRGLAYLVDENGGYLWTKGYIPKTGTANHMEVARPLRISISRGDCDISIVMKDILSLTKLNYNACIYGDGLPVTLRFSDRVGNILTAIPNVNWPAQPFKYYI